MHTPADAAPRVAFQGEPGAYSDLAAMAYFGERVDALPHRTFDDALTTLLDGDSGYAIIPVENAIVGPVRVALDALARAGDAVRPVDEVQLPIALALLGVPGTMLATVRHVRSHPVALAQCRVFLARHPWLEPQSADDTAGAAREVAEAGDRTVAAIASDAAATRYGLEVLASGVQDAQQNWTRFRIVERVG
jgi:prephenate dehydratase